MLILAGDFFFELLQPRLKEANFGGQVFGPCRAGLDAQKSPQCHRGDERFMLALAAKFIAADFHDPSLLRLAAEEGMGSKHAMQILLDMTRSIIGLPK
ncbi:MAG: hypothetical protein ACT4O2_13285 [Beijerinckiaceae bacterium]